MIHNDIEELYYKWLTALAFPNETFQEQYADLLILLYETPYEWDRRFPLDENRYIDGVNLRDSFAYKMKLPQELISASITGPCNMLEMLCAFGVRIDNDIMANPSTGYDHGYYWIQKMMNSLGILRYSKMYWDQYEVQQILTNFMKGNYSADGDGGLFYMPNSEKDLRAMSIWDQMCYYICKNYYEKENDL